MYHSDRFCLGVLIHPELWRSWPGIVKAVRLVRTRLVYPVRIFVTTSFLMMYVGPGELMNSCILTITRSCCSHQLWTCFLSWFITWKSHRSIWRYRVI